MSTCNICCESFNKTNHKKVCCPFCDFESCRTCTQTYLLSTSEDPHCMSCKKVHNREFVDSFCTKRFRNNEYKKHREQVLFERELIRMPETQPRVKRILRTKELTVLLSKLSVIYIRSRQKYYSTNNEYYKEMFAFAENSYRYVRTEILKMNQSNVIEEPQVKFTRKCPREECRGFLDDLWACGLCSRSFCERCNEECDEKHTCDPDVVKTMKLINKDTKPCPSCGTMIHKIDGCAQMWCTTCQTAFDWKSGKIETGRIHNPHYFEFKSRYREHGDIPCGGRPMYRELLEHDAPSCIMSISTVVSTAEYNLMYKYNFTYTDNIELRIDYLLNKINDEQLKHELQKRDKHNEKMRDIQNIYQMFIDTCSDLLRQWMIDPDKVDEIKDTAYELSKYTNQVITRIRNRYTCQVPRYIFLGQY